MSDKPIVFIHTNDQQLVGAQVGAYSMKHASKTPDGFDVRLIRLEETPHLLKRQGQHYLRKGRQAVWHNEDLQSFSPLRRMVPQLMGFRGRALITDPDVFAVGDICELLTQDMNGKAILCRQVSEGYKGNGNAFYASSVMLLDCARLSHWRWDEQVDAMFSGRLDYGPWIGLTTEDPDTIGEIGEPWNSFDKLTAGTKLLHNTERSTQPWKTGLPVDYDINVQAAAPATGGSLFDRLFRRRQTPAVQRYLPHPDPAQERFFFTLLKGALEAGAVEEDFIRRRMAADDVRHDAFELLRGLGYRPGKVTGRPVESCPAA